MRVRKADCSVLAARVARRRAASAGAVAVIDVGAIAQLIEQIATLQRAARDRARASWTRRGAVRRDDRRARHGAPAAGSAAQLPATRLAVARARARGCVGRLFGARRAAGGDGECQCGADAGAARADCRIRSASSCRPRAVPRRCCRSTSRQALEVTSERFASLQQLIDAIPGATDPKAVLDLQARIAAEQAMLQNEQTKLMVLYQADGGGGTRAAAARARARDREHRLAAPPAGDRPERVGSHAQSRDHQQCSLRCSSPLRCARCSPDRARYTVEEYRADATLAPAQMERCRTIPGRLAKTPDCINARQAAALEDRFDCAICRRSD